MIVPVILSSGQTAPKKPPRMAEAFLALAYFLLYRALVMLQIPLIRPLLCSPQRLPRRKPPTTLHR